MYFVTWSPRGKVSTIMWKIVIKLGRHKKSNTSVIDKICKTRKVARNIS